MSRTAVPALVRKPVQITVTHRGRTLMDQVFQTTPIRIGRMIDNDIVLPFDFASRYHCELRFDGQEWTAIDLGSKNGLVVGTNPQVRELKLTEKSEFKIKEVTVHFSFETNDAVTGTFNAYRNSATVGAPQASMASSMSRSKSAPPAQSVSRNRAVVKAAPTQRSGGPLVEVDLESLLFQPHPGINEAKKKALQMVVVWHDQVLETREFACQSEMTWVWNGEVKQLGQARSERTTVRVPKGCTPDKLTITPMAPAAFRVSDSIFVYFRYVPKSKELPLNMSFSDQKMIDPLIASSGLHGAAAIAALFLAHKHVPVPIPVEPERFAKIIVPIPTPPPLEVVMATPTPTPAPIPTATPPQVAEATPEPPPEIKVKPKKTVVVEKKMKKVAIAREQDIKPKFTTKLPPPKKVIEPPPEEKKFVESEVPEAPMKVAAQDTPEPPAATPQPVDVKTVGALATLSLLKAGPNTAVNNVEKIQISRTPASAPGELVGGTPVKGTGEMISQLNQSAKGAGAGKGDGSVGIAAGKIKGGYAMNTTSGKTGNRKIKGSVLGGATYTELTKNEGLTREQVMKEVERHQSEIQQCYDRSLLDNPDLIGRAEFEWEISAQGHVSDVKVKETTVRSGEALLSCVKNVFAGMKFPVAKNGETTTPTIGLPFGRL